MKWGSMANDSNGCEIYERGNCGFDGFPHIKVEKTIELYNRLKDNENNATNKLCSECQHGDQPKYKQPCRSCNQYRCNFKQKDK